jgi:hypothetical protein
MLLCPLFFHAQSLTGLWIGSMSNDSNTVRKDQSYEIALTEYRGKVYGYSRSEFIVDDTLYYIMKRVKGTIEGDVCEVVDDEVISYNFRGRIDKGVKVTSTFRRNQKDSTWQLDGTWKTNATKKYYAVTGKVGLESEKDLTASKIFPHLEELKLADNVAFYKEREEAAPIVKIVKPEKNKTSYTNDIDAGNTTAIAVAKPGMPMINTVPEKEPEIKKVNNDLPSTDTKPIANHSTTITVAAPVVKTNTPPVVNTSTEKENTKPVAAVAKPNVKPTAAPVNPIPDVAKNTVVEKPVINNAVAVPPAPKKTIEEVTAKASVIAGRKSEFSQVVYFSSDSLELSLYDNGEIDGDTVSVYMNGEVIMAKQGLKPSAIKKTIRIPDGTDQDFTLVMFAESLGIYPPNTGLLVIRDGKDVYNLRFSSDFQKSSGIVFRRKNK